MADTAARLAISARRNEVARFTIAVTGIDLTGVAMAMQVRQTVDNPYLLFALGTVNTLAAEGLKLDGVTVTNGVPTSIIKGRINASTMTDPTKVPYIGEIGTDSPLAYAMQWTLNGDAQTRLYGVFNVVGSAFGSDGAPTNRPPSYGASTSCSGGRSSGSLSFGDQVIAITLASSDLVGLEVGRAVSAAATAVAARDGILNNAGFITVSTDLLLDAASKISIVAGGISRVTAVASDLALGASGSFILRAPQAASDAVAASISAVTAASSLMTSATIRTGKLATPTTGPAYPAWTTVSLTPFPAGGTLTRIQLFAAAAGTLKLKRFTKSGSTYTQTGTVSLAISDTGLQTIAAPPSFVLAPGEYIGFYPTAGLMTYTTQTVDLPGYVYGAGDVTTVTTALGANNRPQISFDVLTKTPISSTNVETLNLNAAKGAAAAALLLQETVGAVQMIGRTDVPIETGQNATGINVSLSPVVRDSVLSSVRFYARNAGNFILRKFSRSGTSFTTVAQWETPIAAAGLYTFTAADFGSFPVLAGEYVGFATSGSLVLARSGSRLTDPGGWAAFTGTDAPTFTPTMLANSISNEIGFVLTGADLIPSSARVLAVQRKAKGGVPYLLAIADQVPLLSNGGWNGGIAYGQSNSAGEGQRNPLNALSLTQPYLNLTFGSGPSSGKGGSSSGAGNTSPGTTTVIPLVENTAVRADGQTGGESWSSGVANWLTGLLIERQGLAPATAVVFQSSAGHGSYSIAQLAKGSTWYQNLRDHWIEAKARATAAGVPYVLQTVQWSQGEQDSANGTTRAVYRAALMKLIDDINTDIAADIGQTTPVHLLIVQTASANNNNANLANLVQIQLAQLDAANLHPRIHLVAPMFQFYTLNGGGLHLDPPGQLLLGRYFGRAAHQLITEKREPDRIRVLSATAAGTRVTIRFDVPTAPLQLATDWIGLAQDFGFKVVDDTGTLVLSNVNVGADGVSITMTTDRALAANPKTRYALDYIGSGMSLFSDAFTTIQVGTSGNLCDSTADTSLVKGVAQPMRHIAPHFEAAIYVIDGAV